MADDPASPPTMSEASAAEAGGAEDGSPFATLEPHPEANGALPGPAVGGGAHPGDGSGLNLVFEVPVRLSVELGRADIPIRDVVGLGRGSIVELDRGPGAPLDVRINGVLIGRGEVVLVNEERLGLRFVEVVSQAERVKRLG